MTKFSFSTRVGPAVQFEKLRERLIAAYDAGSLRGINGIGLSFQFSGKNIVSSESLEAEFEDLVRTLEAIIISDVDRTKFGEGSAAIPGSCPYPFGLEGRTNGGHISWRVDGISNGMLPSSDRFYEHCGFAVVHDSPATFSVDEIGEELDRIILKHDKAGQNIDELLIVVAGPNAQGNANSGDVPMFQAFVSSGRMVVRPDLLKRVVVDSWVGGTGVQILYERPDNETVENFT